MTFKNIAIVYDWIDKWGGVERVLLILHEMFPQADFYTSYYDQKKAAWAKDLTVKPSFIQRLPTFIKNSRVLSVPFYPYAFESFDFKDYDLVISVTSSFAKSIITRPETLHVCYLLTPTRYLWVCPDEYIKNPINKIISKPFVNSLKNWDLIAANRSDYIISISNTVRARCKKYYQRESDVICPPFDIEYWEKIKSEDSVLQDDEKITKNYFLVVSRLEPYKRVDLAIDAFNKLPKENLIIVGCGSQLNSLKRRAKENIQFIESVTDQELADYYSHAEVLIMPQEEDFGYVALEAEFFGCPVIAFNKGGITELIKDRDTGIFFEEQNEKSLAKAIERFHTISYNLKNNTKKLGPESVKRFDKQIFIKKFKDFLNSKLK